MPEWINNPHASFVLAAYGVAAVFLIGVGVLSLISYRRRVAEWRAVSGGAVQ